MYILNTSFFLHVKSFISLLVVIKNTWESLVFLQTHPLFHSHPRNLSLVLSLCAALLRELFLKRPVFLSKPINGWSVHGARTDWAGIFLYFLKTFFEKSLSSPNLRPLPIILCVSSPVVMGMSGPLSLSLPSCRGEVLLCTVPMSR